MDADTYLVVDSEAFVLIALYIPTYGIIETVAVALRASVSSLNKIPFAGEF